MQVSLQPSLSPACMPVPDSSVSCDKVLVLTLDSSDEDACRPLPVTLGMTVGYILPIGLLAEGPHQGGSGRAGW